MTFEGFDAALLIESARPALPIMTEPQWSNGPTLEAALVQSGLFDRGASTSRQALFDRHEAIGPDLWFSRSPPVVLISGIEEFVEAVPLRKLSPDEMALLSGGTGSDFDVWGNPYWDWNFPNSDDGGGGGGWGGGWGQGGGPEGIDLAGRDCPTDQAAARDALQRLYNGSPTARALIDLAAERNVQLNLIMANNTGQGQQNGFNPNTNTIYWDAFQYAEGVNTNGSTYDLAPIMLLAHELIHAAHGDDPAYQYEASEPLVMSIANQIAMELNAATGSHYDTTRDSHVRTGLFTTGSVTSTVPSIARPGCN